MSIFSKRKYEDIEVIEYETEVIGDIELTDNEKRFQ